ncbi:MAG: DPP IV N-terminal domain-containing protein [Blastocatellia bacterium]
MKRTRPLLLNAAAAMILAAQILFPPPSGAQDRLKTMPGYAQFEKMSRELAGAVKTGAVQVTWKDGGKAFEFRRNGQLYRYDIGTKQAAEVAGPAAPGPTNRRPERGRQLDSAVSPDGRLKAFHRDRNLWLSDPNGANETAITTDGDAARRTKNGVASWVYGEELSQTTAMWWSPDSRMVAFYRFDESPVPDYFLQLDQTRFQSRVDAEAYPKAGVPNPIVDLFVYDAVTKKTVRIDVRDGRLFDNTALGHYVYRVQWSPDGTELLFNRTNRRQNVMEFTACHPESGKCRVIVREEWPASWTENRPEMQFLKDGKRFIWRSERTGWKNYYLYDLSGRLLAPLTNHPFEVAGISLVDEAEGKLYYTARSGDNHMKVQLHRVGLDGKGDTRLTDPAFNHTVSVAPDGKHFVDIAQTHDIPPVTRLMDANGKADEELARTDLTKYDQLGLKKVELLAYKAADGVTDLHGMLHFPSNFDPARKYPLLVSVYAGPETNGARETFMSPMPLTEYGFLVATFDSRSAAGRGKRFLDAIYQKLGMTEVDDQAAAVRALGSRPYVDKNRVGIFGTSYGGYVSALAIMRYPNLFQAAAASSAVTDWRHYDTIYTERYMWIPQENGAGYDAGSAMKYAGDLKGRLMIYYGTADNNVHPSNAMQLIRALQQAGKSFDVQVGPDAGHSGLRVDRMMEFFIENLVMKSP